MGSIDKVEAYFSRIADGYQDASLNGLWARVRKREASALLEAIGDVRGRDVLELGCGAGFYTRLLITNGARHVWAVDVSQAMLERLPRDNVTAVCGDAAAVDPGRRFDTMVSAGMLEFVPDPAAVLDNAARLATSDASLALLFPTRTLLGAAYRRFHRRNGLNIRLFDQAALAEVAMKTGWSLTSVRRAGPYSGVARLIRGAR